MFPVGMLGSYLTQGVYAVAGPFQPFGGAVDIIVVQQQDGTFKSSPWYVRFGDFQGAFKSRQKVVDISVNDVPAEFHMFLNYNGEAYFEKEEELDESESPSRFDGACSENELHANKSETSNEQAGDTQSLEIQESALFARDDISTVDTSSEYASASEFESHEFNAIETGIETVHRSDGNIEIDFINTLDLNKDVQEEPSSLSVDCDTDIHLEEIVINDYKENFMAVVNDDMILHRRNDTVLIDLGTQTTELKFSYEQSGAQLNLDTSDKVSYGFNELVLERIETCNVGHQPVDALRTRDINDCLILAQGNQDGDRADNGSLIDTESTLKSHHLAKQACIAGDPPSDELSSGQTTDCTIKDKAMHSCDENSNGLGSGSLKDEESVVNGNDLAMHAVQEEGCQTDVVSPVPSFRWNLWPLSFRRSRSEKVASAGSNHAALASRSMKADISSTEIVIQKNGCYKWPQKTKVRTYVPTSLQLASLKLKDGPNKVTFIFTSILGKTEVHARIYLWNWSTRIVISDVDGTITKSDVLGQVMPLVGRDWTQYGVTRLFSAIKDNGFEVLFLSARAITQAYLTRKFLLDLKQDGEALPEGPVFISPDGLLPSLYREVIRRAPHEFKISCLQAIRELFPKDVNPFYAGFGNRITDEISYLKVGIPRGKIFIINPKGEVVVNHRNDCKSYTSLHALVDDMFPPMSSHEQEDFNSWNYWKVPLPDVDDEINMKSSKSIKKTK